MPGEYDDFDIAGAAADVGASLFPKSTPADSGNSSDDSQSQGIDSTPVSTSDSNLGADIQQTAPTKPANTPDPKTPDPRITQGQNSANPAPGTPNPSEMPLPKSWKKDMEAEWKIMSPAAKAYVGQREQQIMQGIQQYANGHNAWEKLITPYAELLIQNPQVNPINLLQGLMGYHLEFSSPAKTNDDKINMLRAIAKQYGINISAPTPADPNAPAPLAIPDEIKRELEESRRWRTAQEQERGRQIARDNQRIVQESVTLVDTFETEKDADGNLKHPYFQEVGQDIIHLIKTGAEPDLPAAYQAACWRNQTVREKLIAAQANPARPNTGLARKPNGQFINVDSAPPKPRTAKAPTMAETISGVIDKHYAKH